MPSSLTTAATTPRTSPKPAATDASSPSSDITGRPPRFGSGTPAEQRRGWEIEEGAFHCRGDWRRGWTELRHQHRIRGVREGTPAGRHLTMAIVWRRQGEGTLKIEGRREEGGS